MRRLLVPLAVWCLLAVPRLSSQTLGTCNVTTPYVLGNGVTIAQCFGGVSVTGTPGQASEVIANGVTIPATAGNSAVLFAYLCEPSAGSTCGGGGALGYVFPSSTDNGYTAISGATYLYSAGLQNTSLTGTSATPCNNGGLTGAGLSYCNSVWYIPSVPSLGTDVYLSLYCSSTAPPTFTAATNCQFVTGLYLEFSGGCTMAGTACLDQFTNNSVTGTSLTATSGTVTYTNELCVALGGTFNDEPLTAINSGVNLMVSNNSNANIVFGKPCTSSGTQTLGQSWTGSDIGGMLLVTLQTAASTAIEPSLGCLPWLCAHRGAP